MIYDEKRERAQQLRGASETSNERVAKTLRSWAKTLQQRADAEDQKGS